MSELKYRNIYVEDRNSGACCAPTPSLMCGVCCDAHVLLLHVHVHVWLFLYVACTLIHTYNKSGWPEIDLVVLSTIIALFPM